MSERNKTCAVNGLLFEGLAACGHHIACANRCGVPEIACEHAQESKSEDQNDEG